MCEEIGKLTIGTYDGIIFCYQIWKVPEGCTDRPPEIPPDHSGYYAHLLFNIQPQDGSVRSLAASSRYIASGAFDGTISLFDLRTMKSAGALLQHQDSVDCLDFYQNSYIVSGSADRSICLWRPNDTTLMKQFRGPTASVSALKISPTGKFMLSGGKDGQLRMWDLMRAHNAKTRAIGVAPVFVDFSEDSKLFLFGYDNEVTLADGPTEEFRFKYQHNKPVTCHCIDKNTLWVGTSEGHIYAWSLETGEQFGEYPISTNRIKYIHAANGVISILTSSGEVQVGIINEDYEIDSVLEWSIDNRITCGTFSLPYSK